MSKDDNIITLKVKKRASQLSNLTLIKSCGSCFHRKFIVDEHLAEVVCAICKEKLNPIWVLNYLANKESTFFINMQAYQDQMKRLNERQKTKCEHCEKMTKISRN